MLFNSYIFIFVFLPLVLIGWYGLNRCRCYQGAQVFLVGMSLWFYAYFEIRYLFIIVASCLVNYLFSMIVHRLEVREAKSVVGDEDSSAKQELIAKTAENRRHLILLVAGCILNLGILGYYKYYDFFIENLNAVAGTEFALKNILLPLGISFFTFQQLSFVIDRCRGKAPHYGFVEYMNFVTFFPQLIAGPIVLHSEIIPQFQDREKRCFHAGNFAQGIIFFVMGLGKKVLLADTLAIIANYGFGRMKSLDSMTAVIVILAFTLELYFDFSGYCDMAVGIGKMFNIEIPDNFDSPYHSKTVKEFWRRWHITLGRFFTTYVYIPLGGSKRGEVRRCFNTMAVFLLSGLWHGANWTFVLWGAFVGIGVVFSGIHDRFRRQRPAELISVSRRVYWKIRGGVSCFFTFLYIMVSWVFFRSNTVADAWFYLKRMFEFDYRKDIVNVAAQLDIPELYAVNKFLSMSAPQYLGMFQVGALLLLLLISMVILAQKRTRRIVEQCQYSNKFCFFCAVIFVWSVISLSGVSTFLYFNF